MKPYDLVNVMVEMIKAGHPFLLQGMPGSAKTSLIEVAAKRAGFDCYISHPITAEPTDMKGLPAADIENERALWLPYGDLIKMTTATRPTLFFFDDFGQGTPAVQASYMQVLLARKIDQHEVSDCVTFAAATNRKKDRAAVSGILEPVKSRFVTILEMEVDAEAWTEWAVQNEIDPMMIALVNYKPTLLDGFQATSDLTQTPVPRTIEHASDCIKLGLENNWSEHIIREMIEGAAGAGLATEYMAYRKFHSKLPDLDWALQNPEDVEIPHLSDPGLLFAFAVGLATHVTKDTARAFMIICQRMPTEYSIMAIKTGLAKEPRLDKVREFTDWAIKNQDVLM